MFQANTKVLFKALGTKRRHGSKGDAHFFNWLVKHKTPTLVDECGNLHYDLRKNGERTLFVAHIDTVSHENTLIENQFFIDDQGIARVTSDVLGADDGAGVAMLYELMRAGVPALYVLTRGEECGGIGAKFLADKHAGLLAQFDRAIAFDRRGYSDVITHQGYGRCCSDEFGEALSKALNDQGLLYMPCDGGVYTDTAEFTEIVPCCTNISVAYDHEHGSRETLDVGYWKDLVEACVKVQWETLPTKRDPKLVEEDDWGWATTSKSFKRNWTSKSTRQRVVGTEGGGLEVVDVGYVASYSNCYEAARVELGLDWDDLVDDEQLFVALCCWHMGHPKVLQEYLASYFYPDNADLAKRYIDMSRMTESLADEAESFGVQVLEQALFAIPA